MLYDDVMEPAVDVCDDVMDLDVGDAVMDPGDDIGGMVMHLGPWCQCYYSWRGS